MANQELRDKLANFLLSSGVSDANARSYLDRVLSERETYSIAAESDPADTTAALYLDY